MSIFSKIAGTITSFFQIGGPAGPGINDNAGTLEAKNAANNNFVTMSGALPTLDQHFATKAYVDTVSSKPIPVTLQFNGNNPLPSNSTTEQWYVVTTTGPNASIGQILWDDGLNTGTVTVISSIIGSSIITTAAFVGGTLSLGANQFYVWTGSAWLDIIPSVSGAIYELRTVINNSASQNSVTTIPANAYITKISLVITTPYSGGATIAIGQTGTPALL